MSSQQTVERKPPPYAPYRSWKNLIDKFRGKQPLPSPFDSGFWNSLGLSGAMISVLRPTMVSLELLDSNYAPTDRLNRLLDSSDNDRRSACRDLMDIGFPEWEHKLDIERVTNGQLTAYLNELGATGDTALKCKSFFTGLAKDADLNLSQHLTTRSSSNPKTKRVPLRKNEGTTHSTEGFTPPPSTPPVPNTHQAVVDLISGGTMTLILDTNVWQLSPDDETFLLDIKHRIQVFNEAKANLGHSEVPGVSAEAFP